MPAAEFFADLFTTAVGEDELLAEVRIPKHTGWGAPYEKFVRVSQQWSIVAVAATVRVEGGSIAEARIGLTNMGSTPMRATAVRAGPGRARAPPTWRDACAAAAPRAPTPRATSTATPTTAGTWPRCSTRRAVLRRGMEG